MQVIQLPRAAGKTTELLQWLREAPEGEWRIFVAHTPEEAMRVYRSTFEERDGQMWPGEFESWQFVGIQEVHPDAWGGVLMGRGGTVVLGIDNLDLVISQLLKRPVGAITMTAGAQS